MKELILLRHGKSDWGAEASSDHERPLNPRGREAAAQVGRFLETSGRRPDRIVSSTAVRARTTAERAAESAGWADLSIELEPALYGASVDQVLAVAAGSAPTVERLLVAGHEPTSSDVVRRLTGARVRFPTANLACIRLFITDWREAPSAVGELLWMCPPRLAKPFFD